jgi:alkylation response protein AidB-like acyl-CoA dehydrogenase
MELAPSEDRDELRRTVRSFLEATSPADELRRVMDTPSGFDRALWARLAGELGLTGLAVPEEYGGSGATFGEVGVVLEEMGRVLLCAPYFATVVLAAGALLHGGDEAARKDYLPGIAAGEIVATVALGGPADPVDDAVVASRSPAGWELSGTAMFVVDGQVADLILVPATHLAVDGLGGLSLFAVDAAAPGLRRTAMRTLDPTRRQARLDLTAVPARLVGVAGGAEPTLEHVARLAAVGLACEQVGGAARVLEMAVGYAGTRIQFGRPIGQFQAIKHRCAEIALEVDAARSAVAYGLWAAERSDPELPVAAAIAKVTCSECFSFAAAENIQVHGGIGFTWEHPAHLYFRRAKSSELMFGDPAAHRENLIRLLTAPA